MPPTPTPAALPVARDVPPETLSRGTEIAQRVPVANMAGGVQRYIDHGIQPGRFLTALFSNDLMGTFKAADDANTDVMREWVIFIYYDMPEDLVGSPEVVTAWIAKHRIAMGAVA